jgi:hypothetical protein
MFVNIHHNAVVGNSSMGDELFSSTPAGAGGVSINTGADYYKFANNWVCGNVSTGDGGGFAHIGFIKNGDIEHNTIIFNQSTNPTITTNGGGLLVMGAPDSDPTTCGVATDQDCLPPPGTISPSDGTGPGLTINANLILGNAADSGSGGGLRLQHVNGGDVLNFPDGQAACSADLKNCAWNSVNVTNNIIVNNVAGWDGAGVSLLDALAVNIVNNTIASNDSTASSGTLFQSLFAPLASSTAPTTNVTCAGGGQSCPQVSGLVSVNNSPVLAANIDQLSTTATTPLRCPLGHGTSGTTTATNSCYSHSIPLMFNDAIWQNRSFYIGVGGFGDPASWQNQQKIVTLFPAFSTTAAATQNSTGACPAGSAYWEIGFRGDTAQMNHSASGFAPRSSLLTSSGSYGGTNNSANNPAFKSLYCNGSRVPPENGAMGYMVNPGTNETNALPNPVFSLLPSAVVDEGNNWINMRWGPLSLYSVAAGSTTPSTGPVLADYSPNTGSYAIDHGASSVASGTQTVTPPATDFFGNQRPAGAGYDIGAVEFHATPAASLISISPGSGLRGTSMNVTLTGANLAGATGVAAPGSANITVSNFAKVDSTTVTATLNIGLATAVGSHGIVVVTPGGNTNAVTFAVVRASLTSIAPSTGARGTSVNVTLTGANLTGATGVAAPGSANITVSNFVAVNATTVTATLNIGLATAVGNHGIVVVTPSGNTNAVTFAVAPPSLTSIAPSTGARGTSVNVTLTGANLTGATGVAAPGSANITVSNFVAVNATTVTATLNVGAATAVGNHGIVAVTPSGNTNAVTFAVN